MEIDQIMGSVGEALMPLRRQMASLTPFRVGCFILDLIATLIGAWLQPLCYRDAGTRLLRAWPVQYLLSGAIWSLVFGFTGVPGIIASLVVWWSIGLAVADWLSAREREKQGQYVLSTFFGWPRLIPARLAQRYYHLPPCFLAAAGLGLLTWKIDLAGGVLVMGSAVAILTRIWVMYLRQREDALDALDAEWENESLNASVQKLRPDVEPEAEADATPDTARLVRRWSI